MLLGELLWREAPVHGENGRRDVAARAAEAHVKNADHGGELGVGVGTRARADGVACVVCVCRGVRLRLCVEMNSGGFERWSLVET